MGEIVVPSLLHQDGSIFSILKPSEFSMPGMLDIVHSSSRFIQLQQDVGGSGSLILAAEHGSSHIHGFNNLGSYLTFHGGQAYPNSTPCSNSQVEALNSSVPKRQQPAHQLKNVMVHSTSCRRKAPYKNPTQREIHRLSERQRREEMNEKLSMLRSILPSSTKKDKASTITHAIKHLTELEEKVKFLRARIAIKKKQCKAENASRPPFEKRTETPADNNRSIAIVSKQFGGDLQDDQSYKIEIENFGTHAILQIFCPWSSRFLLRTYKALDECRVHVVQSIMTKHGGNAVHYFTIEFNSGTPSIDKLMSALEEASSI